MLLGREAVTQVVATPSRLDHAISSYAELAPPALPVEALTAQLPVAIGDVGPIPSLPGGHQYPFACETQQSNLGQPQVDNHDGIGTPIFAVEDGAKTQRVIGFSKDCSIATGASLYYKKVDEPGLFPLASHNPLPEDIAKVSINGASHPFVVRVERGTLNRFIFVMGVLADPTDALERPSSRLWNRRLLFYLRGGVGIGKRQGQAKIGNALGRRVDELAQGYAVVFSTGAHARNHVDPYRAAATLTMVKAQFAGRYGKPEATIAIGESGGAALAYLIAQNYPGIIDGIVSAYAFPDFVTQTIWALDCELLEYYFDITAADRPRWRNQTQRSLIMGLAASNDVANRYNQLDDLARALSLRAPRFEHGGNACSLGWRGLMARSFNPRFYDDDHLYAPAVFDAGDWSYWDDLRNVYGSDAGYAHRTFDNEGVQYGLKALREGHLSAAEFLHFNAFVGGWKPPAEFRQERLWVLADERNLASVSLWSDHNIAKADTVTGIDEVIGTPPTTLAVAPRSQGHLPAILAASHSGQTFTGKATVPTIDVRQYTDPELDLHHSFVSLAARARIQRSGGDGDELVIWTADKPYEPLRNALQLMDEWLTTSRRPLRAQDSCFDGMGKLIAAGPGVWDGDWNGRRAGACNLRHPPYRSSRTVAGAPVAGDVFKCRLVSVDRAIAEGFYGPVEMAELQGHLERVFPSGVCDYR